MTDKTVNVLPLDDVVCVNIVQLIKDYTLLCLLLLIYVGLAVENGQVRQSL